MKFLIPVALYNPKLQSGNSQLRVIMPKYSFDRVFDIDAVPTSNVNAAPDFEITFEIAVNKLPQRLLFEYQGPHTCVIFEPKLSSTLPLRTISQHINNVAIAETSKNSTEFCAWTNAWLNNNDVLTFRYWLDQKFNETIITATRL